MGQKWAYFNENDKFAAAWLRELIKAGLIADGEVDERSIADVTADDVRGFTQCHWFAGIGGWSYALRLASWPDDREVWTGSCPCQPFSQAGYEVGLDDPRDLWPAWAHLIAECGPSVVFGEQVESAIAHGWLDRLQHDLERDGYAVGAVPFPAASVGADGIRQRIWFMADAPSQRSRPRCEEATGEASWGRTQPRRESARVASRMAHAEELDASWEELQRRGRLVQPASDPLSGFWLGAEWLRCSDGKARAIEPGTFPLAHGLSNRVVKLRGYGNAIVPEQAQVFIEAYMSISLEHGDPS